MDRVQTEFNRLGRANTPRIMDALAAFVRRQPEFTATTVTNSVDTLGVRFRDGRRFLVTANFNVVDPPSRGFDEDEPVRAGFATNLPGGRNARFMAQPVGKSGEFTGHGPTLQALQRMATAGGYTVSGIALLTIDQLKAIGPVGILYVHAHGGSFGRVGEWYLLTESMVSDASEAANRADLDDGSIIYTRSFTQRLRNWVIDNDMRGYYAVGPGFIRKHVRLAPNALVYVNACNSGSASAKPFRDALIAKGAGAVMGFNGNTTAGSYPIAQRFFSRLLGDNTVAPQTPPNRPHNVATVMTYLKEKGLDKDPQNASPLIVQYGTPGFGNLRPWIQYIETEPGNKVVLNGEFGNTPGVVRIAGRTYAATWGEKVIRLVAPPGIVGPVEVEARGLKSNQRPLVQWKGTFTSTIYIDGPTPTVPSSREIIRYNLVMRGDGYMVRNKPDETPPAKLVKFAATTDSTARYDVDGYFLDDQGRIVRVWFGNNTIPPATTGVIGDQPPIGFFAANGYVNAKDRRLELFVHPSLQQFLTFRYGNLTYRKILGGFHLSLWDRAIGAREGAGMFLPFASATSLNVNARTKPRWIGPGTWHEVKWTAFTASPAYDALTPLGD